MFASSETELTLAFANVELVELVDAVDLMRCTPSAELASNSVDAVKTALPVVVAPRFVLAVLAVAPPVPPEASGRGVERLRLDSDRMPVPLLVVALVTLFGPAAPAGPVGPCGPDIESVKAGASGCNSETVGPSPCCTDRLNFGTSLMTTVVLTGS